ncbi:MAG: biotin--[acetyl-CoA-carboxylase] ligase [Aggregatilineales bacterium]
MTLTAESLANALNQRPHQFYAQVSSTQDIAFDWLKNDAPAGAVVIADEQVGGRGRQGRGWHNPAGQAIALSMILKPQPSQLSQITMLGALAISDVLRGLGAQDVGIKWPNDVLLNGKKVCGVLPEALWDGDKLRGVVLGMGMNVRVDFTGTELAERAISVETALGKSVERTAIVAQVLVRLDHWRNLLGSEALLQAWKARLVSLSQRVIVGEVTGIAENVDDEGALLIRTEDGILRRVVAGELTTG